MEEEERPKKIQKVELDESHDTEPLMTGAIGGAQAETLEQTESPNGHPATATDKESEETTADPKELESATPKISKRQLRRQHQREQWEAERELRKVKRKEKAAARKERKRAAWQEAKEQGKDTKEELQKLFPSTAAKRSRKSTVIPLTLLIDCGFDDLMEEKERVSLAQQLTRSYSENNKAPFKAHLVLSSFNKLLKERFETVLHRTHEHWKGTRFMEEDFAHAAEQARELMQGPKGGKLAGPFEDMVDAKPEDGEIVYLSSDSPDTLTELKPYSTYIVGGLVDKNRHKGICHKRATEMGIKTAKLPIGDYIQMASRKVLATNHVVEIMVQWLQLRDWGQAFAKTLPPRKGGVLKNAEKEGIDGSPQDDDAESSNEQETMYEDAETVPQNN
ncbi:guanine-1-methyltransferase-domain-containing protein [Aspergillus egyptiacus]|nr:guanine-1-methyltransferase-domain-containing protein [Aspergillus egyptiacus]